MVKTPTPPENELLSEMFTEIDKETDRSSGIISAAWVDDALFHYLKSVMRSSNTIEEDLFNGNGPLTTFSSRSKIAYYNRFIDEAIYNDLKYIRLVRNEFAHYRNHLSYDDAPICDFISNLKTPEILRSKGDASFKSNRVKYISTSILIAGYLVIQTGQDGEAFSCNDEGFSSLCEDYVQFKN